MVSHRTIVRAKVKPLFFYRKHNTEKRKPMSMTPFTLTPKDDAMRLAKAMARAGIASRRESERLIESGVVTVNGDVVKSPALNVTPADDITVHGNPVPKPEQLRVFLYHKPTGLITSTHKQDDRPTIYDQLPSTLPRVISIGRLDINSEGLLLLTNDGDFARHLELPQTGIKRTYRVRVRGRVDTQKLQTLANGITIDRVRYGKINVVLEKQQGSNAWLLVTLSEGKNREIRRVMEYLGYPVNRLIRKSYGQFQLADIPRGGVIEVSSGELRRMLNIPHKGAKAKPRKTKPRSNTKRSSTKHSNTKYSNTGRHKTKAQSPKDKSYPSKVSNPKKANPKNVSQKKFKQRTQG